jgi:hypothetical protein
MRTRIWLKIIGYSILTFIFAMIFALSLLLSAVFTIVRRYTVTNNTNEVLYCTPLKYLGGGNVWEEDEWEVIHTKEFSVLHQYLFYSDALALFPAFLQTDIKVKPNSNVVFYINYEDLNQRNTPDILLIRDKHNNYYYHEADFWSSNIITDKNLLEIAPDNLIKSKDDGGGTSWMIIIFLLSLCILFPYLLVKNVKALRKTKKICIKNQENEL